jgi:hypothetical protein
MRDDQASDIQTATSIADPDRADLRDHGVITPSELEDQEAKILG